MHIKTPTLALAFGLILTACAQHDDSDAMFERSFDRAVVQADVRDDGNVVAEVYDHDGQLISTMDFSLESAEGVLLVEPTGDVYEVTLDDEQPTEVDAVCELAYRLSTGDYGSEDDTQFRLGGGCDGFSGPGCCYAGVGGAFCEI